MATTGEEVQIANHALYIKGNMFLFPSMPVFCETMLIINTTIISYLISDLQIITAITQNFKIIS